MSTKKKKNANREVLFFEYGELLSKELMQKVIHSAKPICRAFIPNAKLTFTGKFAGRADIARYPEEKVYGVIYSIPFNRLNSILRKATNYYMPCIVKTKVKLENGKRKKVLTIKSNSKNPQNRQKTVPPHSLHYMIVAEGYDEWHLNKKRLNKAIETITYRRIV